MINQEQLAQLIDSLQRMRAVAVQVSDGQYRGKHLRAIQAELATGRLAALGIASGVDRLPVIDTSDPDAAADFDAGPVLAETGWMTELYRALRDMGPDNSVESIDAAIRIAASQQR